MNKRFPSRKNSMCKSAGIESSRARSEHDVRTARAQPRAWPVRIKEAAWVVETKHFVLLLLITLILT